MAQFPTFEEAVAQGNRPLPASLLAQYAPKPPEAPAVRPYDLLTDEQKKQVDLQLQPRGALGEIGTGFMRGATYDLPRMVGQGLKSTGKPGDMLYDAGEGINQAVEGNKLRYAEDLNPGAHNVVTRTLASAASMLPAVGGVAASAFLAPETGGASLAIPAAAGAALFGPSSYQDEYEKQIAAGKTPVEAHEAGMKVGALQSVGQAAGGVIAGGLVRGGAALGSRIFGKQLGIDEALKAVRDPSVLAEMGKRIAFATAAQVPLQAGVAAAQAHIEGQDISGTTPWEAATASIGPTMALTGVLGLAGGRGVARELNRNKALLDTVESGEKPLPEVNEAAAQLQPQIAALSGKTAAQEWRTGALEEANRKASSAFEDAPPLPQEPQKLLENKAGRPDIDPDIDPNIEQARQNAVDETQAHADALYAARDAHESQQRITVLENRLISNPPAGMMSFHEYTREAMKAKASGLASGGKTTQEGLRQGYLDAIKEKLAEKEQAAKPAEASAEGQGAFELKPGEEPRAAEPEARPAEAEQPPEAKTEGQAGETQPVRDTGALAPVAHEDLLGAWKQASADAGIDTKVLRGQNQKKVEQAIATAKGKESFDDQLTALRTARDAMKEGTVSRDSMDALVTKLEKANGRTDEAARQNAPEVSEGAKPEPTAGQADAADANGPKQGVAEAQRGNGEVAREKVVPAEAAEAGAGHGRGSDVGEADATRAGEQQASRIEQHQGAGEVGAQPEAGGGNRAEQRAPQQGTAKAEGPLKEEYHFQTEKYYPNRPVDKGSNLMWLRSYRDAQNDANMRTDAGTKVKDSQAARKRAALAKAALKELEETEKVGKDENIHELTKGRLEQLDKADARDSLVQERVKAAEDEAKKEGVDPADDGDSNFAQAQAPNLRYDPKLEQVAKSGKVADVLTHLAKNAPSKALRDLAGLLQRLGMDTKIEFSGKIGKSSSGARKYGNYNHNQNLVTIHLGGENAHTVMHELTHAATVGRIKEARAAERIAPGRRTDAQRSAVASLKELRAIRQAAAKSGVPIRNAEEMVAELLTNEKFQKWLRKTPDVANAGRSLWDRAKDWFKTILGANDFATRQAVDHVLDTAFGFVGDSRFGAKARLEGKTVGASFAQTDSVNRALSAKWDEALEHSTFLGNFATNARKFGLAVATTYHIQKWIENSPTLKSIVPHIKALTDAQSLEQNIRTDKQHEAYNVLNPIQVATHSLSAKEGRALNERLEKFAGEQSRYNIDLSKNFDQNLLTNKGLDAADRGYINQLHAEYSKLDDTYKSAIQSAVTLFRKNYIQHNAMLMATHLRTYRSVDPAIDGWVQHLDILDKQLQQGTNTAPKYYHDVEASNLAKRLEDVFNDVRQSMKGTTLGNDVADIERQYKMAVANPYQHLGRTGDFFTSFTLSKDPQANARVQKALEAYGKVIGNPNEDRHVFLRFTNREQMAQAHKDVLALTGAYEPDSVRGGNLMNNKDAASMRGAPQFVRMALRAMQDSNFSSDTTGEAREFLMRLYLDHLPDTSAQKAGMQRKAGGVPGYDADFVRNFTVRAEGMGSSLARGYTASKYADAFANFKGEIENMRAPGADGLPREDTTAGEQATSVLNEMQQRYTNTLNPVRNPLVQNLGKFGYNYYLAASPAFMVTNLMQPWHLGLPTLGARYGFVKSAVEMGKATAKAMKILTATVGTGLEEGKKLGGARGALIGVLDQALRYDKAGLNAGEMETVRRLIASGQADYTAGKQLGQVLSGASRSTQIASQLASSTAHYSELLNRLTMALAAHNLEMGRSGNLEMAHSRAIDDAVRGTQFDYSQFNTARAFGTHGVAGEVTPLLTQFQKYSFQTIEMVSRMARDSFSKDLPQGEKWIARKSLAALMGTTTLVAGTLGLPMTTAIAAAYDALMGENGDPSDIKSSYREWMADWVGKDVAEAIARGVPRAVLGFDTSQRMGLQDILPGSQFMADKRNLSDQLTNGGFNMLGPAVDAGKSVLTGISQIMDGNVMDGLVQALPLGLQGVAKATRMGVSGYTDKAGNQLPMEVTPWAQAVQVAGFTPAVKAEQSEVSFAFKQREGQLKQQKALLTNQAVKAIERGEDTTEIMDKVQAWNEQNPQDKVNVGAALKSRAMQRATAAGSESNIETLPRYLPQLERYSYAVTK